MFGVRMPVTLTSVVLAAVVCAAIPTFAEDVKIPQTVAEHEALSKSYKEQAVQYRKSETEHKQMAVHTKEHPDFKGGTKNPWAEKMTKHCEALAKDFEKLAIDAEKAADYHLLRAKELQGK